MLDKKNSSGQYFRSDQVGIDKLKNEFLKEAREFVYYRKGEWHGGLASVQHAIAWAQANPAWVSIGIAMYTPSKDLVILVAKSLGKTVAWATEKVKEYFASLKPRHVTRRVIVSKGIDPEVVEKWEAVCGKGGVVTIPNSQKGPWRYFINEKRYAIFTRVGENDLRGIIGNEPEMIQTLRQMFDTEFIVADIQNKRRQNKRRA